MKRHTVIGNDHRNYIGNYIRNYIGKHTTHDKCPICRPRTGVADVRMYESEHFRKRLHLPKTSLSVTLDLSYSKSRTVSFYLIIKPRTFLLIKLLKNFS